MSPKTGDRLGPYAILAPIGAGGMGEVYRAHDTRLRRDVAIKICNESFSERFEREARSIAALNHPHICQLYDIGPNYLVMELIEGEPLKGPYPLDEALRFVAQIAEALEAAHEKGIVHRDLKPANIMIASGGVVKVLDFGLAKAAEEPAAGDPQNSPTITMSPTRAGMILGTAAYMAPEQARGKSVDKRADIWAFGVVLYEMLTGKQLFHGETAGDTLAAVLKEEPNLDHVSAKVQPLLRRCLEKDSKKRLRDIGDAMPLLEDPPPNVLAPSRSRHAWPAWGVAALAILAAAGLAFIYFREAPPAGNMLSLSAALPPDSTPIFMALSPDGRRLAITLAHEGKYQLYLRPLDSPEYRLLPGTDLVWMPFWSPDSRFIGFFAKGKLETIPAAGGPAMALCGETGLGSGGTWNRNGVILFSSDDYTLRRVNASGGACTAVKLESHNSRVVFPEFLPDGNHFLYVDDPADPSSAGVYLAALDNPKARKVLNDRSSVLYAPPASGKGPAYLLFLRGTMLMAQPFDPAKLEAIGDPLAVVPQASAAGVYVAASAAPNGTLVYLTNVRPPRQLTWFDRSGKELGKAGPAGELAGVSLSPEGNIVAVGEISQADPLGAIWLFDIARNSQSRFTPSGAPASAAVWSPDATRIVYTAQNNLFVKDVNGGGQETPLLPPSANERRASDWSRDGRFLIYTENDPKTRSDIWYLPDPGKPDSKPVKFLGTGAEESQGQLSPDGRWLAYFSNESSDYEVYVRPFPSGPGVWQVSAQGAREPRWNRNGKELFYLEGNTPARGLMNVAIQPDASGGLQIGAPHKLFESQGPEGVPQFNVFTYSPHSDGKRFLVNVNAEAAKPAINIITNWQKLIAERAPQN